MTRADWRRIIVAFSTLAALWAVGGFVAAHNYAELQDHTDTLRENADTLRAQGRRLKELTVNLTAALCLTDFAPEQPPAAEPTPKGGTLPAEASERAIVEAYVSGKGIPLDQYGPTCPRAVDKAKRELGR